MKISKENWAKLNSEVKVMLRDLTKSKIRLEYLKTMPDGTHYAIVNHRHRRGYKGFLIVAIGKQRES
jgi:hypothetical protein